MSEHVHSSHGSGIDIRRIIRHNPITSLALVSVFSLIVGLGLVLQSGQMLTNNSRATTDANGPQCPSGTIPVFSTTGKLESSNLYPGTTISSSIGKWKIVNRRGVIVAEAGSGNNSMVLNFSNPVTLDKVLIYDNDHDPAWTLNGYSLPKTANNQWFPAPFDFPDKTPVSIMTFNSNGDSPHFNVCIPGNPPNLSITPTPSYGYPTSTPTPSYGYPTTTPTPSYGYPTSTPIPSIVPLSCEKMDRHVYPGDSTFYLSITPNSPKGKYYIQIMKDGQTIIGPTFAGELPYAVLAISNPQQGKYVGYVSRTQNGPYVTSTTCEYTYTNLTTPTPTLANAVPRCVYAGPDTPVPTGGSTAYVNVLAENARQMKLINLTTGQVIGTYPYRDMGTTPNEIKTFINPDNSYKVEVAKANSNVWYSAPTCMFGGAPTGLTPTGEPLP